jgi:hypothetical protein
MSHGAGVGVGAGSAGGAERGAAMRRDTASGVREQDASDALLRFLGRLSRFGLVGGTEPLLKPAKPGS